MAINIEARYAKTLGLPNFSSHSFELRMSSQVSAESKAEAEFERLYTLLQGGVDRLLERVGFLPEKGVYGVPPKPSPSQSADAEKWACSDGQRALIENMVRDFKLEKTVVQRLSKEMFNKGVRMLTPQEATLFTIELRKRKGGAPLLEPENPA